jgi:MoaA/NifB/PqqE/SkfB family radical SAM enzyme
VGRFNKKTVLPMKNLSPKRFYFAVTQLCNLHCSHCFNRSGEKDEGEVLTTEQVCRIIDAACGEGYECLQITGGEALLRPDIFEIISHIYSKDRVVAIQTNGVIRTPVMEKLMLLNPGRMEYIVSLDGIQTQAYFRGQAATQNAIVSIHKLSTRFPVRINTLLSAHITASELTGLLNLARAANATIAFNPLCPSGRGKASDAMKCEDYFACMTELQRHTDIRIRKGFTCNKGHWAETEDCPVRKGAAIFVSHTGDCYPCGFLAGYKNLRMGNLLALGYDLKKIFLNYPASCRQITAECISCEYYLSRNCFAGCPARIFAANNTFDAREKYCLKEYHVNKLNIKNDGKTTLSSKAGMERP